MADATIVFKIVYLHYLVNETALSYHLIMIAHLRIFFGKIWPPWSLSPLPIPLTLMSPVHLYKWCISEGKMIKTKVLTQSKEKSFFQECSNFYIKTQATYEDTQWNSRNMQGKPNNKSKLLRITFSAKNKFKSTHPHTHTHLIKNLLPHFKA